MHMITSVEKIFGSKIYFDECGNYVGDSMENIFGGETFFDARGNLAATSVVNVLGNETIFMEEPQRYFERDGAVPHYDIGDEIP